MLLPKERKQRKVYQCVSCQAPYLHDNAYVHWLTCPKPQPEHEQVE
jgi:hypothetical protein